ncbi:hypothetical protein BEP19_16185 [Ammoniphilus oxalaticus]|uniref:Uncharacterized protein n=1 Tax=Ammoniphilus oxalaticus TaxID=66863 RepID=A0A419SQL1_9BACL|nr:hypothetical protein [Ammoniphilus oxalaticus]RKD26739.1 hypothetical protein BEP19_16185 [Ammoniphilus oxalaticus]
MAEMAKRSEVKAFEEFVDENRKAVWYTEYLEEVQRLEKEDPALLEESDITIEQLKKKLEGYIAYR